MRGTAVERSVEAILGEMNLRRVQFITNPGNAGDSLIAFATYQLFRRLGIDFSVLTAPCSNEIQSFDGIIMGGGGGWQNYGHVAQLLRQVLGVAGQLPVLILPSTIAGHSELISSLGKNITICAREQRSWHNITQSGGRAQVFLADDVALSLTKSDLQQLMKHPIRQFAITKQWRYQLSLLKRYYEIRYLGGKRFTASGHGSRRSQLIAIRTDREALKANMSLPSLDLSEIFYPSDMSEHSSRLVSTCFVQTIARFKRVVTDRLHVCIAAAILGKDVNFHPNNYYKNEEVFKYSLMGKYSNVEWMAKES